MTDEPLRPPAFLLVGRADPELPAGWVGADRDALPGDDHRPGLVTAFKALFARVWPPRS
ncbi:MAG: hypothetical protein ACI8PZ_005757 [Myxococcota bacterium]|jgi:hypothetical protein